MKLLFVYRFCGLGGVEMSLLNKLEALRGQDIEAHLLLGEIYGSGGTTLADDPRVTIGLDNDRLREVLGRGFDFVSVVDFPEFIDLLEERQCTAEVIFETHASYPPALERFYSKLDHPSVSAIVVPSEFNKRLVEAALHTEKDVVVIPNSVDAKQFYPRAPRELATVELPAGGPLILWVGRLEDEKNPIEFMRIAAQLLSSRSDLRILMIGDAFSGAEYVAYKDRLCSAIDDRWKARFAFCQNIPYDEMPNVYSYSAHTGGCLVSTSLYESAPMIFIEAMSCNCPVVASNVGGVAELVRDGVDGRLYQVGDIGNGVAAINQLIDQRHVVDRDEMVKNARAVVNKRHRTNRIGHIYKTLLQSLSARTVQSRQQQQIAFSRPQYSEDTRKTIPGLVSTIIPVYNRARLLKEAVASVLAQTYDKIEVIIVNDGSTDDTAQVCDQLARDNSAVRVLHTPHEGRAGLAREAGRLVARGEYIQYLDSDDLIMPTKFAQLVALLVKNPDCDIAYCNTRRYRLGAAPRLTTAELNGESHETILPAFLQKRFWFTSTPLLRRSLCDKAGPWSDLSFWEDIEYDMRLASHSPRLCHCKEWLTDIRDHDFDRLSGSRFLDDPQLLSEAVRGTALIYQSVKQAGLTYQDEHVCSYIDDVALIYNRCKDFGLAQETQECAGIVMDATGTSDRDSVGDYKVRAIIEPQVGALKVRPGDTATCSIRLVNESTVSFHAGEMATKLAYHLLAADGAILRFDNTMQAIDEPLGPGESRLIDLSVQAPEICGLYYVEVDIFWAGCTWLKSIGNPAGYVKLLVTEKPSDSRWRLHVEEGNEARVELANMHSDQVRLVIHEATTSTLWHIQLNCEQLSVTVNQRYIVRFRARADMHRRIAVAVSRAHPPWDGLGLYREIELSPQWQLFEVEFAATATDDNARVHFDAGGSAVAVELTGVALCTRSGDDPITHPPFVSSGRLQMDTGLKPLSYLWGTDRGLPVHRYYLERFLTEFMGDIRGLCLEFQDPQYAPRFGGAAVASLDILHIDDSNPSATLVADLTKPNELPSNHFDCIVCTHVLHVIFEVEKVVSEMHRMLKPGGVLLGAVPHVSMCEPEYNEIWRFTPRGLELLLGRVFGPENVTTRAYGNSLTAAGEIRGLTVQEFSPTELDTHDVRFAVEVCGRAVKLSHSDSFKKR